MKLVRPSYEIVQWPVDAEIQIEQVGRTCYKSEDRVTESSAVGFVRKLVKREHWSVIEHVSASVRFVVDRGVSHELVRHRLASYSQESTRYCDYSGGHVEFVIPPWVDVAEGNYADAASIEGVDLNGCWWVSLLLEAERTYKRLRGAGWSPQQARSVLPNSLKTEVVMTANFREWYHVFRLRASKKAHPQMREIMLPLADEFAKRCSGVFGKAENP